jgi:hypothetical protein
MWRAQPVLIDYRCEDGRFPVSASCVTISNLDSLSSSKTVVTPGIRSWKKKTLISLSLLMSESHWWHLLHREVKSGDWTTWFRIWQFQNVAWKRYLQMHLLAEQFVFWWDDRGYPKEKSRPIKWHQCCLLTRQLIFRHHIYTLWCIGLCKQKKLKYVQTSYTLLYAAGSFFGGQKFSGRRKNNHA